MATSTASSQLRYPKTGLYESHTDYVKFEFFEYQPPFDAPTGDGKSKDGKKNTAYTGTSESAKPAKGLRSIFLYMPEDIQSAFSADWGDKSFTNVQRDLLRTAGSALGNNANPGAVVTSLVSAATNAGGRLPSFIAQQIANGLNKVPGGIAGNTSLNDVLGGAKGIVLNPNVELLFQGFGLREFDLNYKFTPRNETEAKEIRQIIHTFKVASLPRAQNVTALGGQIKPEGEDAGSTNSTEGGFDFGGSNNNYISVPNLCQVSYMKGKILHPYLPKWKLSAITGVDINYTPDGSFSTYSDGSPVATGLTLRFAETKLVFADDIVIDSTKAQY